MKNLLPFLPAPAFAADFRTVTQCGESSRILKVLLLSKLYMDEAGLFVERHATKGFAVATMVARVLLNQANGTTVAL